MKTWAKIPIAERYSVSNRGDVRNDRTSREIQPLRVGGGHLQVGLTMNDGSRTRKYVSHLVADAFVKHENARQGDTLIHLDGDVENCDADNLQWRPRWFALKYTMQFRTMRHYHTLPIRNIRTGEIYLDVWDLIVQQGLLLNDIKRSINENTCVWPSMQYYEWIT